ncbi:MAG: chemotaxis response regulator protein-glutamate methylesterase [Thermodesulfobacteriota bacterium]
MRIGIANDSGTAADLLRKIILSVPGHDISWVARTGVETVDKCAYDKPDLVLMALSLPVMDGVVATRRIMAACPCPILLMTTSWDGDRARVFEAMGYGALDAINTPITGTSAAARSSRDALLKKISTIEKLKWAPPPPRTYKTTSGSVARNIPNLVVIGSSTGGPKALAQILSGLPATFEAGIVMAQHVDDEFSQGMVDWLNAQTPLRVRLAKEGARPQPGIAYLGGSKRHLVLTRKLTLGFTDQPQGLYFRPSVDLFFESAAEHWPVKGIAVLLTGMGRDGALGLLTLHKRGWHTIAQDETTSVVYGMPKAARELGAAHRILAVDRIAPELLRSTQKFHAGNA